MAENDKIVEVENLRYSVTTQGRSQISKMRNSLGSSPRSPRSKLSRAPASAPNPKSKMSDSPALTHTRARGRQSSLTPQTRTASAKISKSTNNRTISRPQDPTSPIGHSLMTQLRRLREEHLKELLLKQSAIENKDKEVAKLKRTIRRLSGKVGPRRSPGFNEAFGIELNEQHFDESRVRGFGPDSQEFHFLDVNTEHEINFDFERPFQQSLDIQRNNRFTTPDHFALTDRFGTPDATSSDGYETPIQFGDDQYETPEPTPSISTITGPTLERSREITTIHNLRSNRELPPATSSSSQVTTNVISKDDGETALMKSQVSLLMDLLSVDSFEDLIVKVQKIQQSSTTLQLQLEVENERKSGLQLDLAAASECVKNLKLSENILSDQIKTREDLLVAKADELTKKEYDFEILRASINQLKSEKEENEKKIQQLEQAMEQMTETYAMSKMENSEILQNIDRLKASQTDSLYQMQIKLDLEVEKSKKLHTDLDKAHKIIEIREEELLIKSSEYNTFKNVCEQAITHSDQLNTEIRKNEDKIQRLEQQITTITDGSALSNMELQKIIDSLEVEHQIKLRDLQNQLDLETKKTKLLQTDLLNVQEKLSQQLTENDVIKVSLEQAVALVEKVAFESEANVKHLEQSINHMIETSAQKNSIHQIAIDLLTADHVNLSTEMHRQLEFAVEKNAELKANLKETQESLFERNEELTKRSSEFGNLKNAWTESVTRVELLSSEISDNQTKFTQLEKSILEIAETNTVSNNESQKTISAMNTERKDLEFKLRGLTNDLQILSSQHTESQKITQTHLKQIAELKKEIEFINHQLEQKYTETELQRSTSEKEIHNINMEMTKIQIQNKNLEIELSEALKSLKNEESAKIEALDCLQQVEADVIEKVSTIEKLTHSLQVAKEQMTTFENRIKILTDEVFDEKNRINTITANLETARGMIQEQQQLRSTITSAFQDKVSHSVEEIAQMMQRVVSECSSITTMQFPLDDKINQFLRSSELVQLSLTSPQNLKYISSSNIFEDIQSENSLDRSAVLEGSSPDLQISDKLID
ncbi:hypothetical protein HK096_003303 [Nowakowskiella sp. JEL0078]|nr:hypothetical protein HK096_003303 [Nowakowskiella sp. JEL0078]